MSNQNGAWIALGSVAALAAIVRTVRGSKAYWRAEGSVTIPTEYQKSFGFQMQESEYHNPTDLDDKFQDAQERAMEQLAHLDGVDWHRVGSDYPAMEAEKELTHLQRLPPSIRDLKKGNRNTDHWMVRAFRTGEEHHSYDDVFWLEGEADDEWDASNFADERMGNEENLTYQHEDIVEDGIDSLEFTDKDGQEYWQDYRRGER